MQWNLRWTAGLVLALAFSPACGEDSSSNNGTTPSDAGSTASDASTADTDLDASVVLEPVEPRTKALVTPNPAAPRQGLPPADLPESAARAFAVTGDDHGFTGIWSHCKDGDVRLVNSQIDVCIAGTKSNRFELFTGGAIVDVRRVGYEGDELFDVHKPRADFNVQRAETVEVVRDGTEGGPAIVRVTGFDVPVAYIVGALGDAVFRSRKLSMVTEYRLFPDSSVVEIYTESTNASGGNRTYPLGDWTSFGDGVNVFRPTDGFDKEGGSDFRWVAGFAENRAYGVVTEEPIFAEQITVIDIPWVVSTNGRETTVDGEVRSHFRWFVVGDRDAESIRLAAEALGSEELSESTQTIRLVDSAGNPLAGRMVEIRQAGIPLTALVTDETGRADFRADSGDYQVIAQVLPGEPPYDELHSFGGETEVELAQAGTIKINVDASAGGSTGTAGVTLFGPGRVDGATLHGEGSWNVAPGTWRVVVQRGPEWSHQAQDVTVAAGETVEVDVVLTPELDTENWISADFHQHMEPSIDSEVRIADRVLDNAAYGLDFAAPTDHEAVTDLAPYIAELGLENELGTFPGVEISPTVAHMGIYPLPYDADERGRGSIPLAVLDENGDPVRNTIPEIIEIARGLPSDPIIQINHGRDGSGFFRAARFDPEQDPESFVGPAFSLDFDVMEMVNRKNQVCQLFRDFSGLWNAGYTPAGIGNSDSHGLWGDVGQPRTWLHIPGPVSEVTTDDIRTAMLEHRATVGANAFIDFGDGRLPGDTVVSSVGANVDFHLRVQSPTYASASVLVTIANGEVIDRRTITPASNILDFDDVVSFSFDEDTWITFFVWGPRPSGDISYGFPVMAFTNPLLIDVDGDTDSDGEPWEAPGTRPIDLTGLDNNYCEF